MQSRLNWTPCPMCFNGQLERNSRRVTSTCRGHTISYEQPGDRRAHCGEGILTGTDGAATQATLPEWRARIDKQQKGERWQSRNPKR
jgi:hypothetical protein